MEHHALDRRHFTKTSVVLRTIAIFEVTKAAIVIVLGWGLFLMHRNLADVAERVVQMLRVNPEGKLTNLFFELASHASDRNLWVLALSTLAYASMRSTEAYGRLARARVGTMVLAIDHGFVFAARVVLDAA
jgi:uncharacterized membrane protein (DUF2068 family)